MLTGASALLRDEAELFDGRFQVLFPLGRGRNTVTYKARAMDAGLKEREVVLKVSNPSSYDVTGDRDAIRYEALSLLSARSKHVVRLLDFVETGSGSYLVTEFINGRDLHAELEKRQRGFPVEESLRIILGLLEGLNVVHHAGLVHCNLRPEKIFRRDDGSIVIGGFSRATGVDALERSRRHDDALIDDIYAAPETIRDGFYSPTTDLFAVGVILYQLLTRHLPFTGRTAGERYQAKIGERWLPLSYHLGLTNIPLERCIDRALTSNPARRYGSCGEMQAAVQEIYDTLSEAAGKEEPAVTATPKRVRVRESVSLGTRTDLSKDFLNSANSAKNAKGIDETSEPNQNVPLAGFLGRATEPQVSSRPLSLSVLFLITVAISVFVEEHFFAMHQVDQPVVAEARPLLGLAGSTGDVATVKSNGTGVSVATPLPKFTHELSLRSLPSVPSEIRVRIETPVTAVRVLSIIDGRQLNIPLRVSPADGSYWGKFPTPQRLMTYRIEFTVDTRTVQTKEFVENVAGIVSALPDAGVMKQFADTPSGLHDELKQLEELRDLYAYSLDSSRRLATK